MNSIIIRLRQLRHPKRQVPHAHGGGLPDAQVSVHSEDLHIYTNYVEYCIHKLIRNCKHLLVAVYEFMSRMSGAPAPPSLEASCQRHGREAGQDAVPAVHQHAVHSQLSDRTTQRSLAPADE